MVSDWPPCANDCCETSNHDVSDANDNSTQMHGETSNLDGIRCKAFDFLRESLESQLNQRGGVVLRWEQRESVFMRVIDQQAKEARGKDVCPMGLLFDKDFIDILNRNPSFCAGIEQMQVVWRSEDHAPEVRKRIEQLKPALWQISQRQQKPEEYNKPQEKPATRMLSNKFDWEALD